jgi:hypothetical protein
VKPEAIANEAHLVPSLNVLALAVAVTLVLAVHAVSHRSTLAVTAPDRVTVLLWFVQTAPLSTCVGIGDAMISDGIAGGDARRRRAAGQRLPPLGEGGAVLSVVAALEVEIEDGHLGGDLRADL